MKGVWIAIRVSLSVACAGCPEQPSQRSRLFPGIEGNVVCSPMGHCSDFSDDMKPCYPRSVGGRRVCALTPLKGSVPRIRVPEKRGGATTPLHRAVRENDVIRVRELLAQGADANAIDANDNEETPLHLAAIGRSFDIAKWLFEYRADANLQNRTGNTPLHLVYTYGPVDNQMIELLLANGADPNLLNRSGETPLHLAMTFASPEQIEMLLKRGAEPDSSGTGECTPLHSLADVRYRDEKVAIARLLLRYGADIDATCQKKTVLDRAKRFNDEELVRYLLTHGAKGTLVYYVDPEEMGRRIPTVEGELVFALVRRGDRDGIGKWLDDGGDLEEEGIRGATPLSNAAAAGHLEVVNLLLDRGARIDTRRDDRKTPLQVALEGGHAEVVGELLRRGADASNLSRAGTPLHAVARTGNTKLASALIRHLRDTGKSLDVADWSGMTPLHLAVSAGQSEVVGLLLEAGANPNTISEDRRTPLGDAAGAGDIEMVRVLLASGAKLDEVGQWRTPASLAAEKEHLDVVRLLLEHGARPDAAALFHQAVAKGDLGLLQLSCHYEAPVNQKDGNGNTALYLAIEEGREDLAKALLSCGADVNAKNRNGRRALHAAVGKSTNLVKLLLARRAQVNAADDAGYTPLHAAADHGRLEVARFLIRKGAKLNSKWQNEFTPLDLARIAHDWRMEELLLKAGAIPRGPSIGTPAWEAHQE